MLKYENTEIEYGKLPYAGDIHQAKNGGSYVETTTASAPETGSLVGDTHARAWKVTGRGKTYTRKVQMVREDFTGDFADDEPGGNMGWQDVEMVRSYVDQV